MCLEYASARAPLNRDVRSQCMRHRSPQRLAAVLVTLGMAVSLNAMHAAADPSDTGAKTMTDACPDGAAKIAVSALGEVTLNGAKIAAKDLVATLTALKPAPMEVCYFRENPGAEPLPAALAALNAIIAARLPVSLYSDAAFTRRLDLR